MMASDPTAAERAREVLKTHAFGRMTDATTATAGAVAVVDVLMHHPDLLAALAVEAGGMGDGPKPSIIGRERAVIDKLAGVLRGAVKRLHEYSAIRGTSRGACFEVRILDADDKPTGHIARVTVELDSYADPSVCEGATPPKRGDG